MNFLLDRQPILTALTHISNVVDKVKVMPILGNVKWEFTTEGMTLTTTDTELQMVARLPLPEGEIINQPFSTTVGARKLLDILSSTSEETLSIQFSEETATIRSDRAKFNLSCLPAVEFPELDLAQVVLTLNISKRKIDQLISNTLFAVSQKDIRPQLRGMLIETTEDGTIQAVTTDGHRLAIASTKLNQSPEKNCSVIIPRKAVQEINRLLIDEEDEQVIELSISDHFISFSLQRFSGLTFASKLISGDFPSYKSVIPENNPYTLKANVNEFSQALKQATIISREQTKQIKIELNATDAHILYQNSENEQAEVTFPVEYDGEPLTIAFNEPYIQQALSTLKEETFTLTIASATGSTLIAEISRDIESKHVIMPMTI